MAEDKTAPHPKSDDDIPMGPTSTAAGPATMPADLDHEAADEVDAEVARDEAPEPGTPGSTAETAASAGAAPAAAGTAAAGSAGSAPGPTAPDPTGAASRGPLEGAAAEPTPGPHGEHDPAPGAGLYWGGAALALVVIVALIVIF
ncbi:hypothetical protein [Pseudoroseicyclus sp. CXY001]|uniref:hypothetical protein n=1 Tax=Pseudoroseicyclus sp. CXY001 TaxID=3242492 RepID=UPI00358DA693